MAAAERPRLLAEVERHFSAEAASYTHASGSGLWDFWRKRERRAIMALLKPRPGEMIFDAGCGAGYYTEFLRLLRVNVVAADLSPAMVGEVHRRLGVPALVANLEELGMRGPFDAVLCAGALEFCPHPAKALQSMASLLSPTGRVVVMLPAEGIPGRLYRAFHRRHGFRIQLFSHARLQRMARRSGLEIDRISRIGFNHVVRMKRRESP